jgi:hypothetical protein
VRIEGTNALSNVVVGNTIGLNVSDTDQGNSGDGIHVLNAPGNRIGGASPAERNVISGNNNDGIEVNGLAASNNVVLGTGFIIGMLTDITACVLAMIWGKRPVQRRGRR